MLTDQECFEKLLPELNAIPAEEVLPPDLPVDKVVQAGEKMATGLVVDLERFVAIGLAVDIPLQLEEAVAALRVAETKYQVASLKRQQALAVWEGREPAGRSLRRELLAAQTYAFRKFSTPLDRLSQLGGTEAPAEVIRELAELSAPGREHRDKPQATTFDPSILELSSRQAEELDRLYAEVCADDDGAQARQLRDRAFCRVRRIMGEISDAARHVLRNDPVRLAVYYSDIRPQRQASNAPDTAIPSPTT